MEVPITLKAVVDLDLFAQLAVSSTCALDFSAAREPEEPNSLQKHYQTGRNRFETEKYLTHYTMIVATLLLITFICLCAYVCEAKQNLGISHTRNLHLESSSIVFGLSKVAREEDLGGLCFRELKSIERGIMAMEPWAIKVLDASGAKAPGFIWGQNFWLGSHEGCSTLQNPLQITMSNRYERNMKDGIILQTAPFKMDFRVAHVKHDSPWQVEIKVAPERIIHIGLCLPSTCSSAEIRNLTQTFLDEDDLMKFYDLRSEVLYIKDLKLRDSFFTKMSLKIIAGVVIFTVVMMVAAAFVSCDKKAVDKEGAFAKFFKCFDIVSNAQTLFTIDDTSANSIAVINGLRSVSCFWITQFHIMCFMYFSVSNKAFLVSKAEKLRFQYISNGPLLVDLFFTISGFLQTYNFMKNERQLEAIRRNMLGQNAKKLAKIVFHRYLRLAVPYLILIPVVGAFTSYAKDVSFLYIREEYDRTCSTNWWRNMIFVQNLFHGSEMCIDWSWSLACEMQFFLLVSVLLFVNAKHPGTFKNIVIGVILASIWWTFHLGMKFEFQLSYDFLANNTTYLYYNPFVRIAPHLLGSLCAYWLVQNGGNFPMGAIAEKCAWNASIVFFFACIFSIVKRELTTPQIVVLNILRQMIFSLNVCWMIVGSATGRSCWWSRVLEHRLFQHINRLSYAVYLINPAVIIFVFALSDISTHVETLRLCVLSTGFMVIIYLASIGFSLFFEMPWCNWSSVLKKKSKTLKSD